MSVVTEITFTDSAPAEWVLVHIQGEEHLSGLYAYHITFRAANLRDSASLLGKPLACRLKSGAESRYVHGVIDSITELGEGMWQALLQPELSTTRLHHNLCVFQDMTVPEVVAKILKQHGLAPAVSKLTADYAKQPFRMQYQESDFDFISRILERAGIHYYFRHDEKQHQMVLVDQQNGYQSMARALIWQETWREPEANTWHIRAQIQKVASGSVETHPRGWIDNAALPLSDPNGGIWKKRSEQESRLQQQLQGARRESLNVDVLAYWLAVGQQVSLSRHPVLSQDYCVTALHLDASADPSVKNPPINLALSPFKTLLRPEWKTPAPIIPGVMSAVIAGPSSEEVNTDELGRVKVRFNWDEEQSGAASPSCWVRVAQGWAGSGFGTFHLPRTGTEVLISFIQGNPDAPVITGALYDDEHAWPVALPEKKLCSGIITRSSPDGDTTQGHRLIFDDKKESELIQLHSQKDLRLETKNDYFADIAHAAEITIAAGRSTTIKEGDDLLSLGKGNYKLAVKGDCSSEISGDHLVKSSGGASTLTAAKTCTIESSEKIVLKVGSSELTLAASGITLKGPEITFEGSGSVTVKGPKVEIQGSASVGIKGAKVDVAADAMANIKGSAMVVIDGGLIKIG
jgi:type VI secretion system secreted protein VgrG